MIENIGLLFSLGLLIWFALRGVNIIFATLVCASIVAMTNGLPVAESLSKQYASSSLGAFTFAGKFFLLFAAGALFGKVMGVTYSAASIAATMTRLLGEQRVLWTLVLSSALLTYGGVVVFVVIFTMYPLGLRLSEQANIPKRLLCGAVALGAGTFTMTALPGAPSIHNVIAANALGTDLYAGAGLGLLAAIVMFGLGIWYLESQRKKAAAAGEQFVTNEKDQIDEIDQADMPALWRSLSPLLLVLLVIVVPRAADLWMNDPEQLPAWLQFAKAQPIIWPSFALLIGTLVNTLLLPKNMTAPFKVYGAGVDDSIMPLLNTAAVIGFGAVVTSTTGFAQFVGWFSEAEMPVMLSLFSSVSVVSGITGSASGGLQIFMATFADFYLAAGVPAGVLHRVATVASGGIDSLPHCGAVIATLTIMGLSHKEAYRDMAIVTVVIPVIAALCLVAVATFWYL